MCGINGTVHLTRDASPLDLDAVQHLRDEMACRGPDGVGLWVSPSGLAALAHRRLAIIDLSERGAQPMASADDRFHMVLNGEIYNYRELRRDLEREGVFFRSDSDSEVLLELVSRHGPASLRQVRGMYAFALWDEAERRLLLARDPYGIKPLYVAVSGDTLRFASQVRPLAAASGGALEPAGLVGFLLWGFVPDPWTLYRGIRAVPAGHVVEVREGTVAAARPFSSPFAPADDRATTGDPAAALEDSVRAHMVADVPVAVFLSAGLDSGMITALARRSASARITTFTLGFDEFRGTPLDERPLAAAVAETLGTQHIERTASREAFLEQWPQALAAMDQPSVDGFNTFMVSRCAHEAGLKVVLSGLGGDELFGSYASFRNVPRWAAGARLTARGGVRRLTALGLGRIAGSRPKAAGLLRYGQSLEGAYFLHRGLFLPEELPGLLGAELAAEGLASYDPVADVAARLAEGRGEERTKDTWRDVHIMESATYMRDQLLRNCDWASMAHSLELRVPLVDVRLRASVAASGFEPARSRGKAAFVRQVAPELPRAVFARPKSGFFIPVARWLAEAAGKQVPRRWGAGSRYLAIEVLRSFGVDLGGRTLGGAPAPTGRTTRSEA
jgi:asparagine synthase (glutamine-hydrolysing)